eukprot:CAMPEP_0114164680 /NCGR_PEP_ID=MMETSP0043_2-20121206/30802_1 /TAXON_ID=464988 /ORGANISM="Hemiselmis andersenii, Strain CCMP644" /LENGTH=58 /DNA_ID=CAMNT_0001261367 /DNA_START=1 /DNA_END=174 /DNA_ORIENTATION=+
MDNSPLSLEASAPARSAALWHLAIARPNAPSIASAASSQCLHSAATMTLSPSRSSLTA